MYRHWFPTRLNGLLLGLAMSLSLVTAACAAATPTQASTLSAAAIPTRAGQITEYRLPKGYAYPYAITAGPDGNRWFTDVVPGRTSAIRRMSPMGQITEYPIPSCDGLASSIVVGPDGNLWVLASHTLELVRLNPRTGQMTPYTFGFSECSGQSLTVGPDGNLWLLECPGNNTIDRFSLTDHSLTAFAIPTANAQAYGISSGADGNVWFTESQTGKLGRVNPKTGQITEFPLLSLGEPETITPGPRGDRQLWFVEKEGRIGWVNPLTDQITEFSTPYTSAGPGISAGPDGHLWFTDGYAIGRVTPSTTYLYTYFFFHNKSNRANAITSGPDGNMWFTENYGDKIGKITTR